MNSKQRLGRGIDALFSDNSLSFPQGIIEVSIKDINPNPVQPRKEFDDDSIAELSDSIKKNGLLSPILVRRVGDRYEIIAGERRFRASVLAGLNRIPVILKDVSDEDSYRLSIIENIQREDLNPMEEAEAYFTLNKHFHHTHQDIADAVSKDRSTISNALRLISLPENIKESLRSGDISPGHARAILMLHEVTDQISLHKMIVSKKLSVRETEKYASDKSNKTTPSRKKKSADLERLSNILSDNLSTKVFCFWLKKKGKILIEVQTRDDFERITALICSKGSPL